MYFNHISISGLHIAVRVINMRFHKVGCLYKLQVPEHSRYSVRKLNAGFLFLTLSTRLLKKILIAAISICNFLCSVAHLFDIRWD